MMMAEGIERTFAHRVQAINGRQIELQVNNRGREEFSRISAAIAAACPCDVSNRVGRRLWRRYRRTAPCWARPPPVFDVAGGAYQSVLTNAMSIEPAANHLGDP
jgi:hypothetical protein